MDDATTPQPARTEPRVRLSLLGSLRLEVDGVDRTPPGPLLRVLVAVLGAARGEPVPSARLSAALAQVGVESTPPGGLALAAPAHPGYPGSAATEGRDEAVAVHVSRLRDLLVPADGVLVHTAFGYQLQGPDLWTDLDVVDASVRAARAAAERGDDASAARALRRALDAWPGPLAADLPPVPALAAVRASHERLRRDLVEDLAQARLRAGTPGILARAVSDLEAHLSRHPSRQRAWALLVAALADGGRPADALAAHRRAQAALTAVASSAAQLGGRTGGPSGAGPVPGQGGGVAGEVAEAVAGGWVEHDPVLRHVERAALQRSAVPIPLGDPNLPALVWLDGEGRSRVHSLPATGSLLLGRQAGADVRLPGLSVSRAHAAVLRVRDGWTLLDLGSRFGTRLNGRLVTDGSPLHPGDVVRCGGVALLVTRPSAVVDLAGPAEGLVDAVGADLRIAAVASA